MPGLDGPLHTGWLSAPAGGGRMTGLERDDACVDCGGPCTHPSGHRGVDLLAVVLMAAFMFLIGIALGAALGGW